VKRSVPAAAVLFAALFAGQEPAPRRLTPTVGRIPADFAMQVKLPCRERESNPHGSCPPTDFESVASASSAIPACISRTAHSRTIKRRHEREASDGVKSEPVLECPMYRDAARP
jgi:hypothetical protein